MAVNVYDEYLLARWFYLMGEPRLSDVEYDALEKEFKAMYPDDIHSHQTWSMDTCPIDLLKSIGREDLIINTVMGYAAESIPSVNTKAAYEEKFSSLRKRSRLSFKIDGWNVRANYFNGRIASVETRGRGGSNLDLNHLASLFPQEIPLKGRAYSTGELSIPNSKWPMYKAETGNTDQRASVRTAIARKDIHVLAFCAFNLFSEERSFDNQYDALKEFGFTTPFYKWVETKKGLDEAVKYMSALSSEYDYLTDGLVIENEDYQLAIRLGAWEEQTMSSHVTGYEVNPGMYGSYLKVLCDPITIGGKTYSRISINNIASIVENNLKVGNAIAFSQRSAANVVVDSLATRKLQELEGQL